ncbi:MAG: hypothetical protein R6U13_08265 [Desulfatiglandaceae bacterium]
MTESLRQSSVHFNADPLESESRGGWEVVLEYKGENAAPQIMDLSHRNRWDVQDGDLNRLKPWGREIPERPGQSSYDRGLLISRMNRTQAACWHLAGDPLDKPEQTAFTDITDGQMMVALVGREVFAIIEKAVALDFEASPFQPPRLFQAPVFRVPAQIVHLGAENGREMILIACSRGYGYTMTEALLRAGAEWGLHPAGEKAFSTCLETMFPG